ncbi:MAG: hypothetical protein Q7T81_17555 [Pseudolabrys sp.]|nr:hypothetical protein [Pseudolabrys sp.]
MIVRTIAVLFGVVALSASALAFEGTYDASDRGMEQGAVITKARDGTYKVNVSVGARGCMGEFDGIGKVEGKTLIVRKPDKTDTCKLTLTQAGKTLSVKEDRCLTWHGASCQFEGTLRKQ